MNTNDKKTEATTEKNTIDSVKETAALPVAEIATAEAEKVMGGSDPIEERRNLC